MMAARMEKIRSIADGAETMTDIFANKLPSTGQVQNKLFTADILLSVEKDTCQIQRIDNNVSNLKNQ